MQPISQQPQPQQPQDYYTLLKSQSKTNQRINLNLITIHQLDCTYYGEINKSYQKQGFGILQTLTFQTYFGFWKNNKVEGLGIIFYPSGEIVYGQFSRNTLNGIGIVDDGKFLRLGVYQGLDLNGISFQYNYDTNKWRMIKYLRGSPVQNIRQQHFALSDGIPDMISAQHSLYQCLSLYLQKSFFHYEQPKLKKNKVEGEDKYKYLNKVLINIKQDLIAVGFRDEGGMHGIGVIINIKQKIMINCGYFIGNELNGYCLQNVGGTSYIIGPFFQGIFILIYVLSMGILLKIHCKLLILQNFKKINKLVVLLFWNNKQVNISLFQVKRQKGYNFQQKDFLSAKNSLEFTNLFHIFTPPEVRMHRSKSKTTPLDNKESEDKEKQFLRVPTSGKKSGRNQQKNNLQSNQVQKTERTCVDIIRQKLRGYQMIKNEQGARLSSEQKRKRILNSNFNIFIQSQESIAVEQNPFDSIALGINILRSSPQRKH